MVVGKSCADGLADFKAAIVGEEANFGRRKRVILWKFEDSVIESLLILFFEIVEAKVKIKVVISLNEY